MHMLQVSHLVAESWEEIPRNTFRKSWHKILPSSELLKTQVVAMANVYSGNDSEIASALLPLFEKANTNDFFITLKDDTKATRSTFNCSKYNHAYSIHGIRFRPRITEDVKLQSSQSNEEHLSQFKEVFQQIGFEVNDEKVYKWLTCDMDDQWDQKLTDSEICELVSESDSKDDDCDSHESANKAVNVISHSEAAYMFEQCLVWLEHQEEKTLFNTAILEQLHTLAAEKRMNSFKQTHITSYFKRPRQ
uniref:DDE-1 domain-containing protein n=1 Tax=Amphimedon queenslandica TaxID=400682 RepID=A0A1X7VPQ1_AMPQE